jgi:hypothetical protein
MVNEPDRPGGAALPPCVTKAGVLHCALTHVDKTKEKEITQEQGHFPEEPETACEMDILSLIS